MVLTWPKLLATFEFFLKWRGQISKSRGQNLAIGHENLGIVIEHYLVYICSSTVCLYTNSSQFAGF